MKWKKSADHYLQFFGTTNTYNLALYLKEQDKFGTVEAGEDVDLVLLVALVWFVARRREASQESS